MKRLWNIAIGSIAVGEVLVLVAFLPAAPTDICLFSSACLLGFGQGSLTAVDELGERLP